MELLQKPCFKCLIVKPLSEFYKHKQMADGHLGKCKDCTRKDVQNRHDFNLKNIYGYRDSERERHREKYHRLNYREKHKPTYESKFLTMLSYKEKYPEKYKAKIKVQRSPLIEKGYNLHHWSYNESHYEDVIKLTIKDHMKAHRFIVYDQERFMYRRYDTNELLDTKEKHYNFIKWCIDNRED